MLTSETLVVVKIFFRIVAHSLISLSWTSVFRRTLECSAQQSFKLYRHLVREPHPETEPLAPFWGCLSIISMALTSAEILRGSQSFSKERLSSLGYFGFRVWMISLQTPALDPESRSALPTRTLTVVKLRFVRQFPMISTNFGLMIAPLHMCLSLD